MNLIIKLINKFVIKKRHKFKIKLICSWNKNKIAYSLKVYSMIILNKKIG